MAFPNSFLLKTSSFLNLRKNYYFYVDFSLSTTEKLESFYIFSIKSLPLSYVSALN
jgi:hypothetical protein